MINLSQFSVELCSIGVVLMSVFRGVGGGGSLQIEQDLFPFSGDSLIFYCVLGIATRFIFLFFPFERTAQIEILEQIMYYPVVICSY